MGDQKSKCPKCNKDSDNEIYCSECGFVIQKDSKEKNDDNKKVLIQKLILLFLPVFVVIICRIVRMIL